MTTAANPALPHLSAEFYVWLWFASERDGGTMNLGDDAGIIDVWVEERLSFRTPDEDRVRTVVTGENTSASAEALAALATGKVVRDVQLHLRREEREYTLTLRGLHLDVAGARFPAHAKDGDEDLLYERMYLYEDLWFMVGALYRRFAHERTSEDWGRSILPSIRSWAAGQEAAGGDAADQDGDALDLPDSDG